MDRTEQNTTVVSDLMDGQLRGEAFAMAMQQLEQDERSLQTWHAYHVVGDVLRSSDLATDTNGDFLARLRVRLQAEEAATGQAPVVSASPAVPTTVLPTPAANDSWFSWRATAGLLSVALVAAVGWNWVARPGADGQ